MHKIFKNIGVILTRENAVEFKKFFMEHFPMCYKWNYNGYGGLYWSDGLTVYKSNNSQDIKVYVKIITIYEAKNMVRNHKIKLLLNS